MTHVLKIYFINIKKYIFPIIFAVFTLLLIIFSNSNISAVKNGMSLWINNIVPSLFPFFIAVELLNHTNFPRIIGMILDPMMKPFFNVPGIGAYALLMGIISGYPVGAKIVTDFRNHQLCTKEEGERLLTFTNNSGPLFIVGTVGITLFKDTGIGLLLLATHLLACFSVAFIFRFWKTTKRNTANPNVSINNNVRLENLGTVLSESILSSIHSVMLIRWFYCFI